MVHKKSGKEKIMAKEVFEHDLKRWQEVVSQKEGRNKKKKKGSCIHISVGFVLENMDGVGVSTGVNKTERT